MKYSIYSYKDNALGCYSNPFYDDRPTANVATGVTRAILGSDKKESMKHKVLYKIGEFEDTTGIITVVDSELVLDCDEVLASIGK